MKYYTYYFFEWNIEVVHLILVFWSAIMKYYASFFWDAIMKFGMHRRQ